MANQQPIPTNLVGIEATVTGAVYSDAYLRAINAQYPIDQVLGSKWQGVKSWDQTV